MTTLDDKTLTLIGEGILEAVDRYTEDPDLTVGILHLLAFEDAEEKAKILRAIANDVVLIVNQWSPTHHD